MASFSWVPSRTIQLASSWPSFQPVRLNISLYKIYTLGADRSISALAVHQHGVRVFALQWIFALVIALLLLTAALAISLPLVRISCTHRCKAATDGLQIFGKELIWRRLDDDSDIEDGERESLL